MGYVKQSPEALVGNWAEHHVAGRCIHHDWHVLHTSEIGDGATMVSGRDGKVVMPDLQLFDLLHRRGSRLVEVKAKRGAYTYQKDQIDCTGVDWPRWENYERMNGSVPVDLALVHLRWPLRSSPEIAPRLLWQTVTRLRELGPMRMPPSKQFPDGGAIWDVQAFQDLGNLPNPPAEIIAAAEAMGARLRIWEKPPSLRRPRERPAQYDLFAWGGEAVVA